MAKTKAMTAVEREFARVAAALAKRERRKMAGPKSAPPGRRDRGLRKLTETVGVRGGRVLNELIRTSPELAAFIVDFAYGDVISRDRIDGRTRALVVIAALAAMGNAQPELRTHIGTALNSGCTREEILEVMLIVAVYAGFPAAMNGVTAAREAFGATSGKKRAE
ncbi:MAG TPA: carboxymuconolactone decarboxylase family protein [Opitutus sp.]|nr:carboxymuconolactone decarboxylase family protein [Opitutus sp.]